MRIWTTNLHYLLSNDLEFAFRKRLEKERGTACPQRMNAGLEVQIMGNVAPAIDIPKLMSTFGIHSRAEAEAHGEDSSNLVLAFVVSDFKRQPRLH